MYLLFVGAGGARARATSNFGFLRVFGKRKTLPLCVEEVRPPP
jgi:hypothetical protein